jgi:hypothetical protein
MAIDHLAPRKELEELLTALDGALLDLPADNDGAETLRRIPVIHQGKTIGHVIKPAGDYRPAAESHHHNRVRQLRRALSEGADPYRIVWLALEVGAGTALPALMQRTIKRQNDVKRGKAKAGTTKATPEQVERLLEKFAQATGTRNARVVRARGTSGWPLSHTTALRAVEKSGVK